MWGVLGEHTLSIVIKTSLQTVCHHGGIHNVRGCCGCCWLWLHRRAFTTFFPPPLPDAPPPPPPLPLVRASLWLRSLAN